MIVLSTQKVMQLHQFLMQETGGLDGIVSWALTKNRIPFLPQTF